METNSESKLISLITQLLSFNDPMVRGFTVCDKKFISHIIQIISFVKSMDFDSQPKSESEIISLTTKTISLFNSMDLDSQPEQLSKLIPRFTPELVKPTYHESSSSSDSGSDSDSDSGSDSELETLVGEALTLEPEPEVLSLIYQIFSLVISINPKWVKLISLCPQVIVRLEKSKKIYVHEEVEFLSEYNKWGCLPINWDKSRLTRGEVEASHFLCQGCFGMNHQGYEKAPVEIKHPLHPKHPLHLVFLDMYPQKRECYCCDEDLKNVVYCSVPCDFAINIACVEKPPVLSIHHPKWHEHPLALFSRTTSLVCDVCALVDPTCLVYICPPCGFVVHGRCIDLPRVIRISRHSHRISFTNSFNQGDLSCGVCRREINNDYGGYSCIKKDCSYAVHSKCATQSNVWDGIELEGVPEEDIKELDPFVRISDGIIQHFSHKHHHLKLDENTDREYDENTQCHACITPIYFGNFYSCMQCDFILHEKCANLSRIMYHPIHPHLLTLVGEYDGVIDYQDDRCSACSLLCKTSFFYECDKEGCCFKLHVQCAAIPEPFFHGSHAHPLFLTTKPGDERRVCWFYRESGCCYTNDTFNCLECDFALCFKCATLPSEVRYKHDKHMLTLSYGNETSAMASWCEICERKIDPKGRFYTCNEYCCVTLHIECMIGDLYMKPGSTWFLKNTKIGVLSNNHRMTRPICSTCGRRCPQKIAVKWHEDIFCSIACIPRIYAYF